MAAEGPVILPLGPDLTPAKSTISDMVDSAQMTRELETDPDRMPARDLPIASGYAYTGRGTIR